MSANFMQHRRPEPVLNHAVPSTATTAATATAAAVSLSEEPAEEVEGAVDVEAVNNGRLQTAAAAAVSLLGLPSHLRVAIFGWVLAARSCPIVLLTHPSSSSSSRKPWFPCRCRPPSSALLRACHTIHAEAVRVLYGRNPFVVDASALPVLLAASPLAASSLTSVVVLFRRSPPSLPDSVAVLARFLKDRCSLPALSLTLDFCFSHGGPSAFAGEDGATLLSAFSDIVGVGSAFVKVADDRRDRALSSFARDLGSRLMADPSRTVVPFRFFDLPEPIRRRILRMTDLVFSMDSNWLAFQDGIAIWDGRLAMGDGRPFCCRRCSPLRDFSACPTANITTPARPPPSEPTPRYVCFCPQVAAAFSPTCRCFAPPVQLLRVAKRMREESERILFSENRFILQGDMAASLRFLRALPSSSLRLVRRLDLQLAGDQAFELAPSDPEHPSRFRQWAALVECVVERMDLPNLELAVDAGDSYEWLLTSGTQADDLQPLRDAYTEVVRPLENLGSKGLKSFHAYWVAFFDQERVAERRVMGEDFDSKRTGKIGYKRRNPRFPHGGVPWDMEMEDLGAA